MRWLKQAVFVVVTTTALGAMECPLLVDPCVSEAEDNLNRDRLLDGVWALTRINGAPIPARGYQVAPGGEFLRAGSLTFNSRSVTGGCEEPSKSEGTAVARFVMSPDGFINKAGQSGSGAFEYDANTKVVKLKAYKIEVPGNVNGTRLTVTGLNPETFRTITLEFVR
jgi:hypothetical protein